MKNSMQKIQVYLRGLPHIYDIPHHDHRAGIVNSKNGMLWMKSHSWGSDVCSLDVKEFFTKEDVAEELKTHGMECSNCKDFFKSGLTREDFFPSLSKGV
jgi:hypothetical protein